MGSKNVKKNSKNNSLKKDIGSLLNDDSWQDDIGGFTSSEEDFNKKEATPEVSTKSSTKLDDGDIQTIIIAKNEEQKKILTELEKAKDQIKKLKSKIKNENSGNENIIKLTKNEEKILSAIKSEILIQEKNNPAMSRSCFKSKYKINSKYLDKSIKTLCEKNIITRNVVKYSQNTMTYSWTINNTKEA